MASGKFTHPVTANPRGDLPVVAIVGRPNVGKSAVFNRLVGRRIAIVHDQPGVTRDRITATCSKDSRFPFTVIDTGGIGGGADEAFAAQVEIEVAIAMEAADVILFMADGREGLTPVDQTLAKMLHKAGTPVILGVNKIDHDELSDAFTDFLGLGFSNLIPLSAAHGNGFPRLTDRIITLLEESGATAKDDIPEGEAPPSLGEPMRLAIVGRPNAGKSSLINAILKDERTIVSDVAGTTRDAVDIPYERDGTPYTLIDTAGIRAKNKRDSTVEIFSAMRTEKMIHRAHLCALVIDSADGVHAQDRKIARMILDAGRPCIVLLNKFDLFHPDAKFRDRLEELEEHVGRELFFLEYAPMVAVSALKRDFISQVFKAVERVRRAALKAPGTGALNRILEQAMITYPPPAKKSGHRLKLLYATLAKKQVKTPLPVPRFVLFVNRRAYLSNNYARYLENEIRKHAPFTGLPIRFDIREREKKPKKQ